MDYVQMKKFAKDGKCANNQKKFRKTDKIAKVQLSSFFFFKKVKVSF